MSNIKEAMLELQKTNPDRYLEIRVESIKQVEADREYTKKVKNSRKWK